MKKCRNLRGAALTGMLCLSSATLSLSALATEISGDANGLFADGLPKQATSWSIHGPNNLVASSEDEMITLDYSLPDGQYSFEVQGVLDQHQKRVSSTKEALNNGRGSQARSVGVAVGVIESGAFSIADGFVVDASVME